MPKHIFFRPAQLADLAGLHQLYIQTVLEICRQDHLDYGAHWWVSEVADRRSWLRILQEQYFLLAYRGAKILGFATLRQDGLIEFIYVHKEYQKLGLGTMLLAALEAEAQRCFLPHLCCFATPKTEAFFIKHGFITKLNNIKRLQGVSATSLYMNKVLTNIPPADNKAILD